MSGPDAARQTNIESTQQQPHTELASIEDQSNLTRSQFLMWLGQSVAPEVPLYNMIFTFTLAGEIDPAIFQAAFQCLIDHNDALLLVIEKKEGVPHQRVLETLPYEFEYLDFSTAVDPETTLQQWQDQRKVRQLDLTSCLFDSALIKLADDKFVWYLNQHHLINDAWSVALIYRRMAELYSQLEAGIDAQPTYPAYQDYVAYESAFRRTPAFEKASAYWREKLAPPLEPVQFYGKAATGRSARTHRVSCTLSSEQVQQLKALTEQPGLRALNDDLSRFSIFAATLLAFVYRISGQGTLRLGAPYHSRPTAAFKETAGLFIEVGPLQVEINPNETFASLSKKVQAESLMGLRYAQPGTSTAQANSAYSVLLNYVHAAYPDFAGRPMQSEWVHSGYGDSYHNLRLQVHDFDQTGSFALHFDLNQDVFGPEQQQWAVQHFLRLLDAYLTDPDQLIAQVSLLSEAQQQNLLINFNQTEAAYPADKTVVQLFEEQAAQTPEAIALICGEYQLSYRQLNAQANQLGRYLQQQGVGSDVLVGIYMERSIEVVVAILGVLKAGGAYVPIDPAYPQERLATMLREAQATILLTQQRLLDDLSETRDWQALSLDRDLDLLATQDDSNLSHVAGPTDLAYVIFTSGSTGTPKGTMIEQRGLTNYAVWAKKQYLGGKKLTFPLFTSLAFDLTVTSIYVPLIAGGSIVIYSEADHPRGLEILQIIKDNAVDVIKLTPAHLSLLKEMQVDAPRLKMMIVGGEDFKTDLARTIDDLFQGQVALYNEYGPTEAVVGCMIHRYDRLRDIDLSVPIGTPVDNAQIYILDQRLSPAPPGVVGEMVIGGAGLARGYLNQPELTAEKFIDSPFEPGNKLYRTGDLARWTEQGQLVFLGRRDHQVKIRGARIEPGEIEAKLRAHPAISEAVIDVIQYEQPTEQAELIFCVTCGLPSNYPGVSFDAHGICHMCRDYERYKDLVGQYFKSENDLQQVVSQAKASKQGKYDCMVLLSGGKDSTYVLAQLVEMGLTPLVFSLDNGYISDGAKANIRRVVDAFGLDLVFESTPAMPAIFADSLRRHSNVCHGCFKTIYTLSMNTARKHGINYIFSGLSRGQLFETRLYELFRNRIFDVQQMDQAILDARKVYHRLDDEVARSLDVAIFKDDRIFNEIQFIDFYRYVDVELDEIYRFLDERLDWIRPADTGRSTNCLINEAGIYVHKQEQGYHNYAFPYSWDVRLGHKTREAALEELDDDIDVATVKRILDEVGYEMKAGQTERTEKRLAAYYVSDELLTLSELRAYLSQELPDYMMPAYFVHLDQIPLTQNGKVDRQALPGPEANRPELETTFVAPQTMTESKLAGIWAQTLNIKRVGIHDNFFELGGASVPAVQVIARIAQTFQVELPLRSIFETPTIAQLSQTIEELLIAEIEKLSDEEAEQLLANLA